MRLTSLQAGVLARGSTLRGSFAIGLLILLLTSSGCALPRWARNGCKVGPDYCHPPKAAVAENWIDSDDLRVLDQPPRYADWWAGLNDPKLDELIGVAYRQNLTLREAGTRITQARAQRAIVTGNLFPQEQQLRGFYSRDQISVVAQPLLAPIPGLFSRSFDTWLMGGNLSWELDVWGRFRRAIESSDARLEASIRDYDAILVSLLAEVATTYVEIRTFEQRLNYARDNVRIQEGALTLTQARFQEGKTGAISVHLAKSNLDGTKSLVPDLEVGLRQANNRLCTLLGLPTMDLSDLVGSEQGIPIAPKEIAIGIPADLLRRRPDVRKAERLVAAQSAQIGVATAELYPSIAITGSVTVQAEEFSDLFSSLSQGGSIGPGFSWNVLNYGRILNNVRLQEAHMQELVFNYQQTVLSANQEVEDALVEFLRTQDQMSLLADSAQETSRALELELLNFKEGETDFTGVYVLQRDLVTRQDQLAAAQGEAIVSLIRVYRAIGGGWQIRCPGFQPHEVFAPPDFDAEPTVPEQLPTPASSKSSASRQPALPEINGLRQPL